MYIPISPDYVSNTHAATLVAQHLGFDGTYWLADNRRGNHEFTVPYRRFRGRVYYHLGVLEAHLIMLASGREVRHA